MRPGQRPNGSNEINKLAAGGQLNNFLGRFDFTHHSFGRIHLILSFNT
jgi:hypothetical protein